jgi:hypothetical protein
MTHQREARRRPRFRTAAALSCATALALLVAACDGATQSATPTDPIASEVAFETFASFEPLPSDEPPTEPAVTPDDTGSAGTPPCAIDGLKASHGITEADADDRTTEVVLVAADTCSVDAYPTVRLVDSDGKVLAAGGPAGAGAIDLVGGVAYTSEVRLGNWCVGEPGYPVELRIDHAGSAIVVTGDSFPDEVTLPPCVHEDADPTLTASGWQPAP